MNDKRRVLEGKWRALRREIINSPVRLCRTSNSVAMRFIAARLT